MICKTILWFQVFLSNRNDLQKLYGFKHSYLIEIIWKKLYGFQYSCKIQIICKTILWFAVFLSNRNNLQNNFMVSSILI